MENFINKVFNLNNLELMAQMPDNSVDSVVTDPPYSFDPATSQTWDGADVRRDERDKKAYQQRIANGVNYKLDSGGMKRFQGWCYDWAIELYRVLKPGAHGFIFGASKTNHRMNCALEDAGFEIREVVVWGYASGTPKGNRDVSKDLRIRGIESEGLGTIIKPAYEPITLIRKPISEKTVADNVVKWGVGAINIDAGRTPWDKDPGEWKLCEKDLTTVVEKKEIAPNKKGRWPATIVLTDEILDEYSRFFMVPKPSTAEKTHDGQVENEHSTIKPIRLMTQLVQMVTPVGGICIDIFSGSGTTLVACKQLGIDFIGVELEEKSVKTALERLAVS